MLDVIAAADALANDAHSGQVRKFTGRPYIEHPRRVAELAMSAGLDADEVSAALLHDVLEDTEVNVRQLMEAGFSDRTIELVELLTKRWPSSSAPPANQLAAEDARALKREYYEHICEDQSAIVLKLLDRTDNLTESIDCIDRDAAWVERYLQQTMREFVPLVVALATRHERVADDLVSAVKRVREALSRRTEAEPR